MYRVLYIGQGVGDKNNAGVLWKREGSDTYDTLGELYQHSGKTLAAACHTSPRGRRAYIGFISIMLRIGLPEIDESKVPVQNAINLSYRAERS